MNTQAYEPDNLYFNIRINGSGKNPGNPDNLVVYDPSSTNTPLLNNPSNYYVAVTDFAIPGESIPLTIARVIPNQPDPNLMVAQIRLTYRFVGEGDAIITDTIDRNLTFIPSTNQPPPAQTAPYQIITPYYYVYSYNNIILSINNAINQLWQDSGYAEVLNTNCPPYFKLTTDDVPKLQFIVPGTLFKFKISDPPAENLYEVEFLGFSCNAALINYLGGFNWTFNQTRNPLYLDYIFNPQIKYPPFAIPNDAAAADPNPDISTLTNPLFFTQAEPPAFLTSSVYQCYNICDMNGNTGPGYYYQPSPADYLPEEAPNIVGAQTQDAIAGRYNNYLVFTQENYLLPQWNCLSKIIIYTQSLPIRNQQTTSRDLSSPDIIDKYPILFSFTPNYETSAQARNYIYYDAREQYRLTDLLGTTPLTKIQISVGWADHNGEIFPLYLNPFQSCTIQLGFFKKDLYKSSSKQIQYN